MLAGLYAHIPGLKEAEEKYSDAQVEAFIGIEPRLAGRIEVRPFTPQMFVELDLSGNRFFSTEEDPDEGDVGAFLWRISPCYAPGNEAQRSAFGQLLNLVLLETELSVLITEIQAYVARAWLAMPIPSKGRSGSGSVDISAWPSHIVHMLAKEYGWKEEYIMGLPFRRLWQYVHRIREEMNPDYKERCHAALSIRSRWLEAQNGRN